MNKKQIIFTSIIAIIILIIAIFLINNILNKKTSTFKVKSTTKLIERYDGYKLIDQNDDYYLYELDNKESCNITIKDININIDNSILTINNEKIIEDITINGKVAFYQGMLVVPITYNNYVYDGLIYYNLDTKEYNVVNKYNNLYIDVTNISFNKLSISVVIKNVYDNKILINDNLVSICNTDLNDNYVKENITFIYDKNTNEFSETEITSKLTYNSYVNVNKYCKG